MFGRSVCNVEPCAFTEVFGGASEGWSCDGGDGFFANTSFGIVAAGLICCCCCILPTFGAAPIGRLLFPSVGDRKFCMLFCACDCACAAFAVVCGGRIKDGRLFVAAPGNVTAFRKASRCVEKVGGAAVRGAFDILAGICVVTGLLVVGGASRFGIVDPCDPCTGRAGFICCWLNCCCCCCC